MASDPVITDVDRDQIREYLGEISRAGDDFGRFIEEQFDTLETLAAKLQDRERELDAERALVSKQLVGLTQARERLEAASVAAEQWVAQAATRELAATPSEALPDHAAQIASVLSALQSNQARLSEEFATAQTQLSEELAAAQSQAQARFASLAQSVAAELADARSQLSAASEDLARERQRIVDAAEPFSNEKMTAAQTRWTEELAAAQSQAQSHFASLAQSMAAELAEARSQLSAAREELALEREKISGAVEPLVSVAAAAAAATAAAPIEKTPKPAAAPPLEPRHENVAMPATATKGESPPEDETAGWWGELQQLRRGLSKAVEPRSDAPSRRTKTPTPS